MAVQRGLGASMRIGIVNEQVDVVAESMAQMSTRQRKSAREVDVLVLRQCLKQREKVVRDDPPIEPLSHGRTEQG